MTFLLAAQLGRAAVAADVGPAATVLSTYRHRDAALANDSTPVGAGAIRFRNALGGEVIVVAATLPHGVHLGSFYFYNETRKAQIVDFLRLLGYEAPYYPGDAEILLKWGRDKAGNRLLVALDTGHDAISELPLVFPSGVRPKTADRLGDDGIWRAVAVRSEGVNRLVIAAPVEFITPAVFRLGD